MPERALPSPHAWSEAIRARALAEGFDAVGIAPADAAPEAAERLAAFLAEGRHGDMGWMAETAARRGSVRALWPAARSAILCAQNYGPPADPLKALRRPRHGAISAYAQGADYHDGIKKRLKRVARWLAGASGAEVKVFVDTAPLMEKPLAEAAGLGWQGKHTNLVSREFGSWLFLGAIVTVLDLAPDERHADHCGACTRCLDACPTRAFPAPYQLDARRCISYLTIEHRGQIAPEFRKAIGNRIYGCDDCLAVCPWNKFARLAADETLRPRIELTAPLLAELAGLDDAGFRQVFSGSAVKRIGRDRFVRNVLIAVGNSAAPALAATAEARLDDASPLVRGMAVWALGRLAPGRLRELAGQAGAEPDPEVRAEWEQALASATGA